MVPSYLNEQPAPGDQVGYARDSCRSKCRDTAYTSVSNGSASSSRRSPSSGSKHRALYGRYTVDWCAQRLVPGKDYPAAASEEPEPVIQTDCDLFHRQDLHSRSRQFNGQRDAVQTLTNLCYRERVLVGDSKVWGDRHGALDEKAHGLVQDKVFGRRKTARVGQRERRDSPQRFPWYAQPLTARHQDAHLSTCAEQD